MKPVFFLIIRRTPAQMKKELAEVRECTECGYLQVTTFCWRCVTVKTAPWRSDRSHTTERRGRFA